MSTARRTPGGSATCIWAGRPGSDGALSHDAKAAIAVTTATAQGSARRHVETGGRLGASASGRALASSISHRASPMSRNRSRGSFFKQRSKRRRNRGSRSRGSALGPGSDLITAAIISETSAPKKALPPRKHLVKHGPKRKDVASFVDVFSARLLRAHVCCRSHDDAGTRGVSGQGR